MNISGSRKKVFEGIDKKWLAERLGSSRNTIYQIVGGLNVSAERAKEIERLTNGQVPAAVLRPDIFGE